MEKVVPWADLEALIAPYYCEGVKGRPPFTLQTMLRTHFMQQWFTLSNPAMEEAFVDTPLYRQFAQIEEFTRLPDESTILRFRHRLEKHKLSEQMLETVNDILQIQAPCPGPWWRETVPAGVWDFLTMRDVMGGLSGTFQTRLHGFWTAKHRYFIGFVFFDRTGWRL